jgi:hypothetical protein
MEVVMAEQSPITAIDVLLEPDAIMLRHAQNNNARLLKVFPKGFPLDEAHRPHITLLQRFVRTEALGQVYEVAEKVLTDANITRMQLEAFKYYYAAGPGLGVAGIVARAAPALLALQQLLIAAVAPMTVETGPISAFTASHDEPENDGLLIKYVSTFVPQQTGERFSPHVSTGVAPRDYLDKMLAEPFATFSFSPAGAAVYQLGPLGTAAKKLKGWNVKS